MIYELRVYSCIPGKLPALLKRFATMPSKFGPKHGIKQAGFWTCSLAKQQRPGLPVGGSPLAEREQKWNDLPGRPEWHQARDASEKDGPLIGQHRKQFLRPMSFLCGDVRRPPLDGYRLTVQRGYHGRP